MSEASQSSFVIVVTTIESEGLKFVKKKLKSQATNYKHQNQTEFWPFPAYFNIIQHLGHFSAKKL
jgi:hypothetical protein